MSANLLRTKFLEETKGIESCAIKHTYLVVAVKLPTGAIELITNTQNIDSKVEYYKNAYDDNFCLKANSQIEIIDYMLV